MRWLILFLLFPLHALAEERLEVDVELFLAVDLSRSMSPDEIEIQRRGYAEALSSDEVWGAINNGLIGRIAITYVEWAGEYAHRVVVPWTLIQTRDDARTIAQTIRTTASDGMQRTSISGALLYAADSIEANAFNGLRRVIDISGDGPNNQGRPVLRARDAVLAKGIIINGLPLMTQDTLSRIWDLPDLDEYFRRCVIGGPGAFVIPVYDWSQFADAIKRKLVLEISSLPEQVIPVQLRQLPPYDCLIGEKTWERNRPLFDLP
ncbi:MAG: DUF1194 domain-containing protein [Aestuariivita sp.]|uniref:DUF1194 domain-containing protein n=1 Tax=Aestuariivita sp. TaxID=1872407 RepID=UPI003BAE2D9A